MPSPLDDGNEMRNMMGRRPLEEAEMDITPMIDITFLLLIFFIVAAKIDDKGGVSLPQTEYAEAVLEAEAVTITLVRVGESDAALYLGDVINEENLVTKKSPLEREAAIRRYVEDEFKTKEGKTTVLLKADAKLKHGEIQKVLQALSGVDVELSIMHVAVLKS